jgi:tRNAThr (cytosine32-N3)-methyltransferase
MIDDLATLHAAIDAAHDADPARCDGRPAERVYAERLERWLLRLVPRPTPALAIAARAQHLERWTIPRASFPMDRPGYHAWRQAVHRRQGQRAEELLRAAGADAALAQRVNQLVAKAARDAEGQALEDAACLVFLEHELAGFAAEHPDYTREKTMDIIRRTWRKMSPAAQALAATITLPPALANVVRAATAG